MEETNRRLQKNPDQTAPNSDEERERKNAQKKSSRRRQSKIAMLSSLQEVVPEEPVQVEELTNK